jgi:hypothetical protein
MATKTFKIGEYSKGGIITVETSNNKVTIISKEWDYSKGSTRGSDQSNAKEWNRIEVLASSSNAYRELSNYLIEDTTSYYADEILKWIETKVKLNQDFIW